MGVSHANNGSFKEGNPGKPKGAINKVSQKVRESVVKFLENNIDQVTKDYLELETASERLQFIEKLLPYAIPKHAAIQVDLSGELQQDINVFWGKLPQPNELRIIPDQSSDRDKEGD